MKRDSSRRQTTAEDEDADFFLTNLSRDEMNKEIMFILTISYSFVIYEQSRVYSFSLACSVTSCSDGHPACIGGIWWVLLFS
jgi:hypothetical protein